MRMMFEADVHAPHVLLGSYGAYPDLRSRRLSHPRIALRGTAAATLQGNRPSQFPAEVREQFLEPASLGN
jgi:hypothetical protein